MENALHVPSLTNCPRYVFISTEIGGRMVVCREGKPAIIADSGDVLDLSNDDLLLPGITSLMHAGTTGRNDCARIERVLIPHDVPDEGIMVTHG